MIKLNRNRIFIFSLLLGFSIILLMIIIDLTGNTFFKTQVLYKDDNNKFLEWVNNKEHPVAQDDPVLVKYVRDNFIVGMNNKPYNFSKSTTNPYGIIESLIGLLKKLKRGFFVELGANDGEWGSNTLYLERVLGWNGLLIEGSPSTYKILKQKNRKAWHSNAAVSTIPSPMRATFYENKEHSIWGGLTYRYYHGVHMPTKVQCIPLYTLLLAINQTVVDFLSLDLEGSELDVLRTIPFHKLRINSLVVEVVNGKEGPEPVKELMRKNGFILFEKLSDLGDFIFVNTKFLKEINY